MKVFTNEIRKELAKYPIGSQRVGKNAVIAAKVVLPVCENPTPYFYILEYDGGDSLVILWHDGIENDDFSYQNQSIMELEKCYDVAISENWELPAIEFIGKSMKEVAKNDIALSNFAASDKYSDYSFLNSTFNY